MATKSEKIQMGLGVVILIVGASIATWSFVNEGTKAIGDSCFTDNECKDGPCLALGGEKFCTSVSASCPPGSKPKVINVTLGNSAGFNETSASYCIPDRLADKTGKGSATTP